MGKKSRRVRTPAAAPDTAADDHAALTTWVVARLAAASNREQALSSVLKEVVLVQLGHDLGVDVSFSVIERLTKHDAEWFEIGFRVVEDIVGKPLPIEMVNDLRQEWLG
jgi:hypothetical protein